MYYTQNILFGGKTINGSNTYQYGLDGGLRYLFFLDATEREDYIALKLMYHTTKNNFVLSSPNNVFMKSYRGVFVSFERSLPVTGPGRS
jgi:hypothetical protein